MRSRRTAEQPRLTERQAVGLVAACAALAVLFWLFSPNLLAQDGGEPPPDAGQSRLYLPAIQGGAALEAGAIIPGEFIVVLQDEAVRAAQGQNERAADVALRLSSSVGGELLFTYETALSGFAVRVPHAEAEMAASALASDPNVAYVEPNQLVQVEETEAVASWGLDRIDQASLPLNGTYTYANSGAGVHAYIIDTGIRATHREFTGRIGSGYTAISDGQGSNDCKGHGTHVAGAVGGATYGVAKQVTLHPVRVLNCSGSGSNAGVIAGVDWVTANRVRPAVANMSLGGSVSTALDAAVRKSIAAGVTYAVAAGNDNKNACSYSPARTAEAITVGATTSTDARSSFSNYGTCLDIFAPGSAITSAVNTSDTATATYNGTSMASPHAAGAAALYLAANPNASPAQVAQALTVKATLNRITGAGAGSPNRLLYTGFIGASPATPTATPAPPTATPTATPMPATATPTATPTAAPLLACSNLLVNPGFEDGNASWTESSSRSNPLVCTGASCGTVVSPHTGSYVAWLGGANNEADQISQIVTLPAGQKLTLSYWLRTVSSDRCARDYGYVRVLANGVLKSVKTYSLCTTTNSNWAKANIDLSAYAGKTITLIFRVTTDSSWVSSVFVDDIALVSASACTTRADSEEYIEPAAEDSGEDIVPDMEPKTETGSEIAEIRP